MSVAFHGVVVALSVWGLPHIQREAQIEEVPMVVELVTIANETNIPSRPDSESQSSSELKKDAPKSVSKSSLQTRTQQPSSPPEPDVVVAPPPKPLIKPKPEPKQKTEPKPVLKPALKPQAPSNLAKAKPRRKPKPPVEFASVLKNLAKEFERPMSVKKSEKGKEGQREKDNFEQQITKVLNSRRVSDSADNQITMTERHAMINSIRTAIRPCWNIQPGAKGAQDIVVVVRATLSPQGKVRQAWVTNRSAFQNDPFKLAAAETAQRAVLNQACQPFKLDPKKYDVWKDVTLNFNPSKMFGR